MDEISQKEIHYLYELINRGVLRPPSQSIVTNELTKLLDRLNLPCSINSPTPETPEPKISLFITATFQDSKPKSENEKISLSLTVPHNTNMVQLVRNIETAQTYRPNSKVQKLQNVRSGREYSEFDNSTLKSHDFRDGDRVIVQCKHQEPISQAAESAESVHPMIAAIDAVKPSSNNEVLVAACHYVMLDQGFSYLTEQPSTVAGFAPSLKEVPKDSFLVQGWNSEPIRILYKHKLQPGKIFELQSDVDSEDAIRIMLGLRKGSSSGVTLKISDFIVQDCDISARNLYNIEDLYMKWVMVVVNQLPALLQMQQQQPPQQLLEPQRVILRDEQLRSDLRPPMSTTSASSFASSAARNPISVGSSDLNPFPSPIFIGAGQGGGGGGGGGGGLGGLYGGGSLVGPEHPMFRGTYPPTGSAGRIAMPPWMGGTPEPNRGGGFPLLPVPRYDPTGPVLGPHTDICGDDEDYSGEDPMFRRGRGRGGRGGGRGGRGMGSSSLFPGEPGPDHFKPPGWN